MSTTVATAAPGDDRPLCPHCGLPVEPWLAYHEAGMFDCQRARAREEWSRQMREAVLANEAREEEARQAMGQATRQFDEAVLAGAARRKADRAVLRKAERAARARAARVLLWSLALGLLAAGLLIFLTAPARGAPAQPAAPEPPVPLAALVCRARTLAWDGGAPGSCRFYPWGHYRYTTEWGACGGLWRLEGDTLVLREWSLRAPDEAPAELGRGMEHRVPLRRRRGALAGSDGTWDLTLGVGE